MALADMHRTRVLAALLVVAVAACSQKVVRVDMDASRLALPDRQVERFPLMCDYRISDVVDDRVDGGEAGGLSANAFKFADAAAVVRKQLFAAGLSDRPDAQGPGVSVHIVQLYLMQNLGTKIPVAVYRVRIGDGPVQVLRAQATTLNWNGTQNEAYAAFGRAMADITHQLVAELNQHCPAA